MITILAAPPYLAVQDAGRTTHRAEGMPPGGAMDAWALRVANVAAGNAPGAAALEWGLGSGVLRFERETTVVLGGAGAAASLGRRMAEPYTTLLAREGDELRVEAPSDGRFLYVAVGGGVDVPELLGSRATYLPARFGGFGGRRLAGGDALTIGAPDRPAPPPGFTVPRALRPPLHATRVRVIAGPQRALLDYAAWASFLEATFTVSDAADRMGYRLTGPLVTAQAPAALPSEPACPGAVQLPGGGSPIVLMPDGPTVGGYPKIAVVCTADLGVLAQLAPRAPVRFAEITVREAQAAYRRRMIDVHTVQHLAGATSRTEGGGRRA